jgi:serine/threonine protein kinase
MVVKETRSVTKWDDEYQFFGPKKEFPREHYMSLILPRDSNNTINIIGSRLFPDSGTFRLYMEYCPAGDLADLFHSYRDRSLIFPEPYLWKVFQDLARAVHAMDNPSGHGLEGDEAIAHM